MKQQFVSEEKEVLTKISNDVRGLVLNGKYEECDLLLQKVIGEYPHASEPHNLFGILFEKKGCHEAAMKHFRAAWALDPTYLPARFNLDQLGSFYSKKEVAYNESDCPELNEEHLYETEYNEKGIGRIIRRKK